MTHLVPCLCALLCNLPHYAWLMSHALFVHCLPRSQLFALPRGWLSITEEVHSWHCPMPHQPLSWDLTGLGSSLCCLKGPQCRIPPAYYNSYFSCRMWLPKRLPQQVKSWYKIAGGQEGFWVPLSKFFCVSNFNLSDTLNYIVQLELLSYWFFSYLYFEENINTSERNWNLFSAKLD